MMDVMARNFYLHSLSSLVGQGVRVRVMVSFVVRIRVRVDVRVMIRVSKLSD